MIKSHFSKAIIDADLFPFGSNNAFSPKQSPFPIYNYYYYYYLIIIFMYT